METSGHRDFVSTNMACHSSKKERLPSCIRLRLSWQPPEGCSNSENLSLPFHGDDLGAARMVVCIFLAQLYILEMKMIVVLSSKSKAVSRADNLEMTFALVSGAPLI